MPKKINDGPLGPTPEGVVSFFSQVWGSVKQHAPGASRAALSLLLRGLSGNREVLDFLGRKMAEQEEVDWTTAPLETKLLWRHRAESALAAVNAHLFRETEQKKEGR